MKTVSRTTFDGVFGPHGNLASMGHSSKDDDGARPNERTYGTEGSVVGPLLLTTQRPSLHGRCCEDRYAAAPMTAELLAACVRRVGPFRVENSHKKPT